MPDFAKGNRIKRGATEIIKKGGKMDADDDEEEADL